MEVSDKNQHLRLIDKALLQDGLDVRAQNLNQFLEQHLKVYRANSQEHQAAGHDPEEPAQGFGELLVKITTDMLKHEREHKLRTNWNSAEEEREMCRLTAELGRAYYLAAESDRRRVVFKCLGFFGRVPMPVEELAFEEEAIRGDHWTKDAPIEERRIWLKIEKGSY